MEALGYVLVAGWIVGAGLTLMGTAMVLLSGPALRLLGRLMAGASQSAVARPGLALRLLLWSGRIFGVACFSVGVSLFYAFCPHIGSGWDASAARFESPQGDTALREIVVKAIKPIADDGSIAGLTVGVIDGDKKVVYGFGRKSTGDGAAPDGDTVYEIGSITKVFTSLLLASLVEEGKVRLDEPLSEALGQDFVVPAFEGTPIRLIDLSTHTAGLPRMPEGFSTPKEIWESVTPGNPYADYTASRWMDSLELCRLASKPGTRYEYSNFGGTLLGYALGNAAGLSYAELIRTRIAEPLKMAGTAVTLSPKQSEYRVPGYAALIDAGSWRLTFSASPWDFPPGTEGAGGLKSTVNDLLRFIEAQMAPPQTPLGRAMEETQLPRRDTDMNDLRMGLGWHILEGADAADPVVWHNGGTRGYSSFMGFCRKGKRGVVLLSNSFDTIGRLDGAGLEILNALKKP